MTIRLLGVLPDPFGTPCPKAIIRFTALTTEGSVLKGTDAEETTTKKGEYDFPLEQGRYLLEIQYSDELMESGSVLVDEFTPSPLTLVELIRYTTPLTPPLVDPNPTNWSVLFQEVINNDEWDRQSEQQVRDEDVLVNEDKTIHKDEGSYLSKETLTNTTGSSTTVQQTLNYKDATGREAGYNRREITTDLVNVHSGEETYSDVDDYEGKFSSLLEGAESASSQTRSVTKTTATETSRTSLGNQATATTKTLDSSGSELTEEVSSSDASITSRKYIDAEALVTALIEQGVVIENVEAFDRLTVTATGSKRDIQVDELNVGDTFKVDTKSDVVTVTGQLKLTNGDDYKGPVGDSQYLEYAYATTEGKDSNDWHIDNPDDPYDLPEGTVWRKHRTITITSGTTHVGEWSNPYLLTGEDGSEGDTLYWKYKYKATDELTDPNASNPAGWEDTLKDGRFYRIERLVSNGEYQGTWSTPAKIAGTDGDNGELVFEEYMYSPYGTSTPSTSPEHWHSNFSNGDFYRSSRLIKYAAGTPLPIPEGAEPVMVTEWTTPALITPRKGFEYFDGEHGAGSYVMEWEDSFNGGLGYSNLILAITEPLTEGYVEYWYFQATQRASKPGDILTIQQSSSSTAVPKQWIRGSAAWENFALLVDGNTIVNGTLAATALKAGTTMTDTLYVSSNASSKEMTLSGKGDGTNGNGRLWIGHVNYTGAPFRVDKSGNTYLSKLTAESAVVKGHVEAASGFFYGQVATNSLTATSYVNIGGDSASRLKITNDRLEVYDNGTLRVRLGRL